MKQSHFNSAFKGVIILLLFNACFGCKKNPIPPLSNPLSTDALAYIKFDVGKYFIYRDSVTNQIDSVVVTQSELQPDNFVSNGITYNNQQYSLIWMEYSPYLKEWLSGTAPGNLNGRVQLIANDDPNHYLFQDVTTIIPTMVVEGKTYNNVLLTTSSYGSNGVSAGFTTTSANYWVKGVGLIKRSETNNAVTKTWTLLRSN